MENLPIPPEQNLEQPVVPPPPKINPMLIIGGFIIIAIILTGGIFIGKYLNTSQNIPVKEITPSPTSYSSPTATPTLDPTANWKMYTDPSNKFLFKYPLNFDPGSGGTVMGPLTGVSKLIYAFADNSTMAQNTDKPFDGFTVYEVTNTKTNNFSDYVNNEFAAIKALPYGNGAANTKSPLIVTGINGFKISVSNSIELYYLDVPNNEVIVFSQSILNEKSLSELEQILSTFKFLDVSGKSCQSNADCGSGYICMVVAGNVPVDENGKEITPPKTCYPKEAPLPQ